MSAARLERIGPAMQAYVDDGRVAGVMTMVARRGQVVHWAAAGVRDVATDDPLEPDDIFRIYSMTKPITSVATMMLVEEGKVALDDPVARFIPEFGDVMVLTDAGESLAPDRPITIEHLLTHTSGLTYGFFGDSPVDRAYRESDFFTGAAGLDDFARQAAALPLLASPGERWNYSISTDILGRVIEVASGQSLDAFFRARITGPLGMDDTAFVVPADKRGRFTGHYAVQDGALQLVDSPADGEYTRTPAWLSGGGGLTSTASDYIRFAQMLLQDGRLGETQILAPETVQMMRANRLPEALAPIQLGNYLSPGYGFGLGFAVVVDADSSPEPDNDGVFRWAGAANTFFWIDPAEELIGLVWIQLNPFAAYALEREFQPLVYEA
ncbi:MAG: beta-lactamase family protein, partial [Acidobacteria bacterium]|nr:beta-lactamase family protein [Acidobacteriota bacterium]